MWEYVGSVELWSHSVELSQRAHIVEKWINKNSKSQKSCRRESWKCIAISQA